jgi:hypothetical protein
MTIQVLYEVIGLLTAISAIIYRFSKFEHEILLKITRLELKMDADLKDLQDEVARVKECICDGEGRGISK